MKPSSGLGFFAALLYGLGITLAILLIGFFFLHDQVSVRVTETIDDVRRYKIPEVKNLHAKTHLHWMAALSHQNKSAALILKELKKLTPLTITLADMQWQANHVWVSGHAHSDLDLAGFLDRLQKSTVLMQPALVSLVHKNHQSYFQLQMTIPDEKKITVADAESMLDDWQTKFIKYADRDKLLEEMAAMSERNHLQIKSVHSGAVILENNYLRQSFRMELLGEHAEIAEWIAEMANLPWMVVMKNFSLANVLPDQKYLASVEFSIFYLKEMTHDALNTTH